MSLQTWASGLTAKVFFSFYVLNFYAPLASGACTIAFAAVP
jgi:hypothetical protein